MIGIDTNILLRLLLSEDPDQTAASHRLLKGRKASSIRIANIVLAELVWTLSRRYKLRRHDIAAMLKAILQQEKFVFESRSALMSAVLWFEEGRADFADYLVAAVNDEGGASPTFTFDQNAAYHSSFALLEP